nr:non-structural maintenance of chromosomes element 1 homolog [Ciona intestinalis]|eukprot:XP_002127124.1 non-structural maintenance of chromosomes element 1 homolog [Ciona intestinalis]
MSAYKKCHIYFLQSIMNKTILSESECQQIRQESYQVSEVTPEGNLLDFLQVINDQLHPFHFKIRQSKREDTGETVYVLISLVDNDLNRLVVGGDFARAELEYFKKILEIIIVMSDTQNVGTASSIDILNLADSCSPRMSKTEAKRLLTRFVDERWFYDNEGIISLSPRCILELEQYLSQCFDSFVSVCTMCSNTVFQAQVCSNCSARMHHHCARTYSKRKTTSLKCLSCNHPFPHLQSEDNGVTGESTSFHTENTSESSRKKKRTHAH